MTFTGLYVFVDFDDEIGQVEFVRIRISTADRSLDVLNMLISKNSICFRASMSSIGDYHIQVCTFFQVGQRFGQQSAVIVAIGSSLHFSDKL